MKMDQPVPQPAPALATAKPSGEAGPAPALNVQQIKTMLNLPDTATDIELITALVELVAGLQQKYEALLTDAVQLEEKLTNRDMADFPDIITAESQEFWRNQFLTNREGTLAVLGQIRDSKPATPPACPGEAERSRVARIPLRNRLADQPRSVADVVEPDVATASLAVKIRNRAVEIGKSERLPFAQAFARAEKELTPST
jgi:hypothetical protein